MPVFVFDENHDPIGVNTGLLAVCDPKLQASDAPKQFACAQGTTLLTGTGFGANEYTEQGLFGEYKGEGAALRPAGSRRSHPARLAA